jgi:hypothetical protein
MDYTFVSKYARWIPEKKRRETWNEAVDRVKQMMLEKYAFLDLSARYNLAATQSLNTMQECTTVLYLIATV